jgi:hypothetical protein
MFLTRALASAAASAATTAAAASVSSHVPGALLKLNVRARALPPLQPRIIRLLYHLLTIHWPLPCAIARLLLVLVLLKLSMLC